MSVLYPLEYVVPVDLAIKSGFAHARASYLLVFLKRTRRGTRTFDSECIDGSERSLTFASILQVGLTSVLHFFLYKNTGNYDDASSKLL